MTTQAAAQGAKALENALSPMDAATIIRTLGVSLVEAYGAAGSASLPADESRNAWGSKQRERLLIALVKRLALHARTYENAALAATDSAVAEFARDEFQKAGGTRSPRDRAPIAKNISKVIGRWMQGLRRAVKQDAVVVSMLGVAALGGRERRVRVYLSFAYPRRIVSDRKLLMTARFEEVAPDGKARPLPFRANPAAPDVTLPEKRRLTPAEAKVVEHLLLALRSVGENVDNPDLKAYAESGLQSFVPWSVAKMLVAVFASFIGFSLIASAAEWVYHRSNRSKVTPQISTRCAPTPAIVLRFTKLPAGGASVVRSGVVIPIRGGVAIDENPPPGPNTYTIRAAKSFLVPWEHEVTVDMPRCPAMSRRPISESPLSATLAIQPHLGIFDLTKDKAGFGDSPPVLATIGPVNTNHADEHLDFYITRDCDECRRKMHFIGYMGLIQEPDVKVTIDFGDRSHPITLAGDQAHHAGLATTKIDVARTELYVGTPTNSSLPSYAFTASHDYAEEGSYVVSVEVIGRGAVTEPYHPIKTLRRRAHVGLVGSVEMFESFDFQTSKKPTSN